MTDDAEAVVITRARSGLGEGAVHADVAASYGDLAVVPAATGAHFAQLLSSDGEPDPQWVVDAYLKLADMPAGERPPRTVVGMTWGVDQINAQTQSLQDAILNEMQLDTVLGGVGA